MDSYTYIVLKINNINGDVEVMNKTNTSKKESMKDILDIYKLLNISVKDNKKTDGYIRVSKYDYSQKSLLDINTYAKI